LRGVWLAATAATGLFACSSGGLWTEAPKGPPPLPPALLEGVRFEAYRDGVTDAEVRSQFAEVDWAQDEVRLQGVQIVLPGQDRGPLAVQAEHGRIDLVTKGFVLGGRVVARTGDGQRLETARLRYEAGPRKLVSDDPVRVLGQRLELVGSGMEIDVATRRVRLRGPVRAQTEGG
jgi:LPS export ABC transporter protein LptC